MKERMTVRKEVLPAFLVSLFLAGVTYGIMQQIQPYLLHTHHAIYSFGEVAALTAKSDWKGFFVWYFAEVGEPVVSRTVPTAAGMIIFAIFGYWLEKKNSKFRGTDIVGGSGLFLPILVLSMLALLLCDLIFHQDAQYGFVPTFIAICTIIPFTVPRYGYKGMTAVTQIVLAAVLPYLFAKVCMSGLTEPLHLPRALSGFMGICLATILAEEVIVFLPWMKKQDFSDRKSKPRILPKGNRFFAERLLADPNEMSCWGSSWSTIGMYLGGICAWILNPNASSNLEGYFPLIMCSQFLVLSISIFFYYPWYRKGEQVYTFPGYVVISSLINTYTLDVWLVVVMIFLSALMTPLVTAFFIKNVKRWKFQSVQILMGVIATTVLLSFVCQFLCK